MSNQISTASVRQFSSNVFHLSQQKGSVLAGAVRHESQKGKYAFYDRIGATTAQLKTSQHMDTPQIDSEHSRRGVTLEDYVWADLIDSADVEKMLLDPTSPYAMSAMWAMGRQKDVTILTALSGTALTGVDGGGTQTLGNAQKLASVASGAGANLNVQALRRASRILNAGKVDGSIRRHLALNASALENLLSQTEVTSADYNSVKALVQGDVDTFMGFKFHRTEELLSQSGTLSFNQTSGAVGSGSGDADTYKKCVAWAEDGILLSTGMEVRSRVSERADKNYSTQVFAEMGIGAVRMEEAKVVEILCSQ